MYNHNNVFKNFKCMNLNLADIVATATNQTDVLVNSNSGTIHLTSRTSPTVSKTSVTNLIAMQPAVTSTASPAASPVTSSVFVDSSQDSTLTTSSQLSSLHSKHNTEIVGL